MISTETNKIEEEKNNNIKKSEIELLKTIDQYDINFLNYLNNLYKELKSDKLDLTQIKNNIDALQQFNSTQQYDYLNNLLYPEKCKGVKIPTPIPVPSCSFQLHNCLTLSTNSSGNLGILFNPFFLYNNNIQSKQLSTNDVNDTANLVYLSTLYINNNDTLRGSASDANWMPASIGQMLPAVYDQYRLVSASLVIKYIGRLDIASGVIGGAIVFDELDGVGGGLVIHTQNGDSESVLESVSIPTNISKYGNFDLAMDSFYHQENLCLEGIRELYFPIDNSFEEYVRMTDGANITLEEISNKFYIKSDQDYIKNGFNWMIYVLGAPANSACFKLDVYLNFECLPSATFLNYIPITLSPMGTSSEEKRKANLIVQQKPIMKLSETNDYSTAQMPNIWYKLKKKFNGNVPGLSKLMTKGIINAIPGLKSGFALAGSMLDMQLD